MISPEKSVTIKQASSSFNANEFVYLQRAAKGIMKSLIQQWIILGLFFLIFTQGGQAQEYIVMSEELAPFGYLENGELTGLTVEITREIFKIVDHPDNIMIVPWARGYSTTLEQPNRILLNVIRKPERESLFKWVGPLVTDRTYFYKKRGSNIEIKTLEDAKKIKSIAVTRDFASHKFLEQQGFTNLKLTVRPVQTFQMLELERVDLTVIGELSAAAILQEAKIDPKLIQRTEVSLYEFVLNLAFSKNIPDQEVNKWQQALDVVRTSGRQQAIIQKYIIE